MAKRCNFCRRKIDSGSYCDSSCKRAERRENNIDDKVKLTRAQRKQEAKLQAKIDAKRARKKGR